MRKLASKKGFTLVEMLACVITLLLVSMICSTGMNFALNVYQESVFESENQMLESTLNLYLGDILRHAAGINTESTPINASEPNVKKVRSFTNAGYHIYEGYIEVSTRSGNDGGRFMICPKVGNESIPIVNGAAYGKAMYVTDFVLGYDDTTGMFYGTYKIKSSVSDEFSKDCSFVYRTIAELN